MASISTTIQQIPPATSTRNRPACGIREPATLVLLLGVYVAWGGLTYLAVGLPWWLLALTGGYLVCLHGSLQHEAVHGHLTDSKRWNTALVMWPLGLGFPYQRYRTLHLRHHASRRLSDPFDDPESFYFSPREWRSLSAPRRLLALANQTLAGRLVLGPWLLLPSFWRREASLIVAGDRRVAVEWSIHLLGVAAMLVWVVGVCGLPVWQYLLLFAWPGLSLTLLRSYTEHRLAESPERSTAVVEGSFVTRLLFLNNNFHLVHHTHPELPWRAVREAYLARRSEWLARSGGFYYRGYGTLVRRYLLCPKDHPAYSNRL